MRMFVTVAIFGLVFAAFCSPLAAQNNPTPYVNNPVVPTATAPGGPGFTLTVNGAGFVNGAVLKWNGSPRATTVVSNTRVTATILASDIVTPGTIFITVSNPAPGGGISNSVFFEVTTPTESLAFVRTETDLSSAINLPSALTVFDYRNTGDPYLVVANGTCPADLNCIVQHASITIALDGLVLSSQTFTANTNSIASGDFNGDGLLDLITFGSGISISLNLSPPDSWSLHKDYPYPAGCSSPFALGDFNQDGHFGRGAVRILRPMRTAWKWGWYVCCAGQPWFCNLEHDTRGGRLQRGRETRSGDIQRGHEYNFHSVGQW